MAEKLYIQAADVPKPGEYYLVEYNTQDSGTFYRVQTDVPRTIPGDKPLENGFLGSYNNNSRRALGKVRVLMSKRAGNPRHNKWFISYERI
jgi:hypothetical protein